jgi:hypothetical protein
VVPDVPVSGLRGPDAARTSRACVVGKKFGWSCSRAWKSTPCQLWVLISADRGTVQGEQMSLVAA